MSGPAHSGRVPAGALGLGCSFKCRTPAVGRRAPAGEPFCLDTTFKASSSSWHPGRSSVFADVLGSARPRGTGLGVPCHCWNAECPWSGGRSWTCLARGRVTPPPETRARQERGWWQCRPRPLCPMDTAASSSSLLLLLPPPPHQPSCPMASSQRAGRAPSREEGFVSQPHPALPSGVSAGSQAGAQHGLRPEPPSPSVSWPSVPPSSLGALTMSQRVRTRCY